MQRRAAGAALLTAMGREKLQYAERRSGELLPRRAREYVPPHSIPVQPEARTMENATVKLSPDLDPQNQLTQIAVWRVRSYRRVWLGLALGLLIGSAAGLAVWAWRTPPVPASDVAEAPLSGPIVIETIDEPEIEVTDSADLPLMDEYAADGTANGAGQDNRARTRELAATVTGPKGFAPPSPSAGAAAQRKPSLGAGRSGADAKRPKVAPAEPEPSNRVWIRSKDRKVWLK
jgi:hypothetical protein